MYKLNSLCILHNFKYILIFSIYNFVLNHNLVIVNGQFILFIDAWCNLICENRVRADYRLS